MIWQDPKALRALLNDSLEEKKEDARGNTQLEDKTNRNFILIFGCKSGTGISARSTMAEDFSNAFIASYNDFDMTCQFSDVLDRL